MDDSKICEKDEFGLCWLYFQNFHPFSPLLAYKLYIAKHNLNPQQTAKHSSLHNKNQQGFPGIRNSSRNLLAQI